MCFGHEVGFWTWAVSGGCGLAGWALGWGLVWAFGGWGVRLGGWGLLVGWLWISGFVGCGVVVSLVLTLVGNVFEGWLVSSFGLGLGWVGVFRCAGSLVILGFGFVGFLWECVFVMSVLVVEFVEGLIR